MMHRCAIRGKSRALLLLGAALALVVFSLWRAAHAGPPRYFTVAGERLETRENILTARLGISVDNITGLYEMLKNGASVELVVAANLERVRTFLPNVSVIELELVSSLHHNPLTREFSLYMPGEPSPLIDKNLHRLLAATWNKFSVTFGPLSQLDGEERGTDYQAVLKLALQHAKPPPWLPRGFMVWSKNIVDPETVTLPFHY